MAKAPRWSEADLQAFVVRGQRAQAAADKLAPRPAPDGRSAGMKYQAFGGRKESKLERRFDQQLAVQAMPAPLHNFLFLPDRDFEIDRAWPQWKLGVEIQGGAHGIRSMIQRDCEKLCLALLAGWWVFPLGDELVRSGRGMELVLAAIDVRKKKGKL